MKEKRIEIYNKTNLNNKPKNKDFACMDCPLGNWEFGFNGQNYENDLRMIDKSGFTFLSCYCSKKYQYTFLNDTDNYNHILFCEFKNEVLNEVATAKSKIENEGE